MYVESQPPFYNAAATGETDLGPRALLRRLKQIEDKLGRKTGQRYGPREIDLDLIAYGSVKYVFRMDDEIAFAVPHALVGERRFVLQPLFDLDPNIQLPGLGRVDHLLESTTHQASTVRKVSDGVLSVLRA